VELLLQGKIVLQAKIVPINKTGKESSEEVSKFLPYRVAEHRRESVGKSLDK